MMMREMRWLKDNIEIFVSYNSCKITEKL